MSHIGTIPWCDSMWTSFLIPQYFNLIGRYYCVSLSFIFLFLTDWLLKANSQFYPVNKWILLGNLWFPLLVWEFFITFWSLQSSASCTDISQLISSSVNCLENFKYNGTWRLSWYIVQPFCTRTSTSIWKNRKEKQSLMITNLRCAVWGSGPLVENVQESANWKFGKPFRKKWLYTYIHACCVCVHSLYKEVCWFPGLTRQLSQSWVWQQPA